MTSERGIIEDIRVHYGVGYESSDEIANKIIEEGINRTNRLLSILIEDLYSKEIRFVLELIQNADDNSYKDLTAPSLKFILDNEKIIVQNNEEGFTEAKVRAICDVGKTTKSKVQGFIGEKGIGFKSVFLVSNNPQILSHGFHFCFKREDEDDKLGFVVPYWIDEVLEFIDPKITNIVLPFRKEANIEEITSKLGEIEPTLLLFLQKLREIEIHDKIRNSVTRFSKKEQAGKTVIVHAEGTEYWKLVRQQLTVPTTIHEEDCIVIFHETPTK